MSQYSCQRIVYFLLFISILLLNACVEDLKSPQYKKINLPTSDLLTNIVIDEDGSTNIIGGSIWHYSFECKSEDRINFKLDTIANKLLFGLYAENNGNQYAVGVDGYLFSKPLGQSWNFHRLQNWDILKSVIKKEDGFLAAGGKSYANGYIYLINNQYLIDTALYFSHEIAQIIQIEPEKYLTVGYGNIMLSTDNGRSWEYLPNEDDFFSSVDFKDSKNGLVVGFSGSILKTKDGGHTFETLISSSGGTKNRSLRKVKHIKEDEWIIVGNYGIIYHTKDFGLSWMKYKLDVNEDLYDFAVFDNELYVVGTNGFLAILSLF